MQIIKLYILTLMDTRDIVINPIFLLHGNCLAENGASPENLGYPINTIDDEGSMIVAADGKTAYYSSDRSDTKGGLDIYTFELRRDLRPLKTLWVKGRVYDIKTKNGLPSTVELTDVNSRQPVSKLRTDEDGHYLVTLPVGKEYAFNVNRKGYLFYSENYNISDVPPIQRLKLISLYSQLKPMHILF